MAWHPSSKRTVLAIAAATLLAHLVVASAYGIFRDELYFIECGRHPQLGYADQPPLVPLLAAATQLFGASVMALRFVAGLGHAAAVVACAALAGLVAEEAGGDGRFARPMGAAAVALSPMFLGLGVTLSTTSFEPLAWTFVAYAVTRAVRGGESERRWLVYAGVAVGLSLETKYAIPFFLAPLLAGVALGPSRRVLLTREAAIGTALGVVIAIPSAVWQLTHHLPFLDLMHAASHGKNVVVPPLAFAGNQLLVMNPVLAPMWLAGVGWCLFSRRLARVRFLAIAFVGVFALMMLLHGKDYYTAPAYGLAFAPGAAFIETRVRSVIARGLYIAAATALAVVAAPTTMPILEPAALARYMEKLGAQPQQQEASFKGAALPQLLADMLGWRELEARVADAWRALPEEDRAKAVILTSNYGEAGAIDVYGRVDGLPRAISGHNQYGLWGPGDHDGSVILRVNGNLERYQEYCATASVVGRFGVPYAMPYESDGAIVLCRGLRQDLRTAWPEFIHID